MQSSEMKRNEQKAMLFFVGHVRSLGEELRLQKTIFAGLILHRSFSNPSL